MRKWQTNLWDTFKQSYLHQREGQRCHVPTKPIWSCWLVRTWGEDSPLLFWNAQYFHSLQWVEMQCIAWQRMNPVKERRRKCKSLKSDLRTVKSPSWSISPSGSVWLSQSGPHPPFGSKSKAFDLPTMKIRRKHGRANLMEGVILKLLTDTVTSAPTETLLGLSYHRKSQGVHFLWRQRWKE